MALPETIAVKYSEEEAEFVSVRPVVRQTFRLHELVVMVLGVTGKDIPRMQQIFRSGTVMFHFYRYWWAGFDAGADELAAVLRQFPDDDPAREFRFAECAAVSLESSGLPPRVSIEIPRAAGSRRRWLRPRSLWDALFDLTAAQAPQYLSYSYARRADLYGLEIAPPQLVNLVQKAARLASGDLRARLPLLPQVTRAVFVCPRTSS